MSMSVIMLALYGKLYLRLSKAHGTSSTAGVRMPADNRSYRLPRFHIPPAGIDALVNHSVVSISESIQLPVFMILG